MTFDPTKVIWTAAITVWNPISAAEETFYVASRNAFTLHSGAAAETQFSIRLDQPALASRSAFRDHQTTGRGQVSVGNVVLNNAGGFFDAYLGYGFDGRAITIAMGQTSGVYPDAFTTVLAATMESALFGQEDVTITLRDWSRAANVPLQTSTYGGTNALPAGLDGTSDLAGKAKPVLLGTVRNMEPVCVNTSKLIYQINNGAVASIAAVYDSGVLLGSGLAWTAQTSGFSTTNINAATYGNGLFVIGGDTGKLATSPDGVTWTSRTSGFGTTAIRGLTYGNGIYVAVGDSGTLTTSPDGTTWTARTSTFGATGIKAVAYGNGKYIAVGATGVWATSTNGTTWTAGGAGTLGVNDLAAIAYSGVGASAKWVTADSATTVYYSTDGAAWASANKGVSAAVKSLAYGSGVWVAACAVNSASVTTMTSPDAVAWTIRTRNDLFEGVTTNGVAYGNGQFVAVANVGTTYLNGQAAFSPDGVRWSNSPPGFTTQNATAVAFGSNTFVIAGNSGNVATSQGAGTYANTTDLQDDTLAPAAGTYKTYLAGGYIRLGSSPAGRVTATASQGAASANRTAAQLFTTVLQRAGFGVLNQLLFSQAFDNAAWTKANVTVTADNTTAPDGTTTADKIAATATTTGTLINQTVTAAAAVNTYTIYVKQGTGATTGNTYGIRNNTTSTNLLFVTVNLSTGALAYSIGSTGALVTSVGNGWYRVSLTVSSGITAGDSIICYAAFTGSSQTAGDFSYAWGAQFNAGNQILDYTPTTTVAVIGGDWKYTDVTTLDTATSAECGYYSTTGDQVMCADVIDQIADSVGAWWSTDAQGIIRIKRLTDPDVSLASQGSSLATSPWVIGSGAPVATNAVATYGGRSFSRITSANSGPIQQPVTLPADDTYYVRYLIKSNGVTGTINPGLFDSTSGTFRAAIVGTIASDGTITFAASFGSLVASVALDNGVYAVEMKAAGCIAAHTNILIANANSTATSVLLSDFHLVRGDPAATITQDTDMDGMQHVQSADDNGGIPVYRTVVRASKNYAPLTGTDLAGSVSDADRATFGALFLDSGTTADASVQSAHPLSNQTVKETLISATGDASTEATRLQTLFGSQRAWFDVPVYLTDTTAVIELGDVIEMQSTRFGIGAGTRVVVMGIHPDAQTQRTILSVWR